MREGRNLVRDAVKDAQTLREAAIGAAKNELIEQMTPKLKEIVEKAISGAIKSEDTDRMRRGVQDNYPGESHTGFEESTDKGDHPMDKKDTKGPEELDLESLMSMIGAPGLSEEPDESAIPNLGEAEEEQMEGKKKDDEEEKVDEELEISEEALRAVYEGAEEVANLAEVQVTKGFGDMTPAGELDDVSKDVDKGLADVKKGEHAWDKETPPSKQDFTVKEAIRRGLAENKRLKSQLIEATNLIRRLHGALTEVNLFNSKVLHVNRILNNNGRLTKEQKAVVLESIDRARTIDEVKMVYETIQSSFKVAGALTEGSGAKKPHANSQSARKTGGVDPKVLSESADREHTETFGRMRQLAGLVNK